MARSTADPVTRPLPPHTSLSSHALYFLNSNLCSRVDLDGAPTLLSKLQIESESLDRTLSELNEELRSHLIQHSSYSDRVSSLFSNVRVQLDDLRLSSTHPPSDGGSRRGMGEELQALAKEVARVETVRNYAETALKLDTYIGDIEDAVSSTMNRSLRRLPSTKDLEDMRLLALKTLKLTEDVLSSVIKAYPQWTRLVAAVDHRIDRALAILRPQAIADHRALLTSLGWPPPLSTLTPSNPDSKPPPEVQNPLFTMQGDLKLQYCESFLALCGLQELQRKRKNRQLAGHYNDIATLHQPLWVIEELVNPISIASQRHFTKWAEKPEFIFALVYKITRDYVDSMDDLLQPLVDEAMLSGYSCREEWISAMVSSLSTYLAKEIFPIYIGQLENESDDKSETQSRARISWLNLVDLMIAFDKRVESLATQSGMLFSFQEDGSTQKMSSLCVFIDRPDWLDLWAEIELNDVIFKLNSQIEDERNWVIGEEENKSPLVATAVFRRLKSVIDRCRSVPSTSLRSRFVKLTGGPIIYKFLDCLKQRCQEAEGLTALTDDSALTKVAKSVNAARHFESVLKELCEDVYFLEMESNESENGIFHEEIKKMEGFRNEWIEKLSTVVLRGFDSLCRDYMKNKKQWQEKSEEMLTLSRSFVEALDYSQGKLSVLEEGLNKMDFTRVWRNLAAGIDKLIFTNLVMGNVKFHDRGVERLSNDLTVLFGVFGAWCLRPEGFFPKVNDGLKLLRTAKKQLKNSLIVDERWLRDNGIKHLTSAEVEKIMKNRVFSG
ncbi:rint1-like protein mag2 [Phtheirospermum japonicum]|uniref:Rint1-like protein mag2 n=1 Tax=Phtheirospermum japonicum TaxID=374723 RepID=A0A830CWG2_9LAMI|nr:rint1-like protein mag2 [Phtheirospermum japonicum]